MGPKMTKRTTIVLVPLHTVSARKEPSSIETWLRRTDWRGHAHHDLFAAYKTLEAAGVPPETIQEVLEDVFYAGQSNCECGMV